MSLNVTGPTALSGLLVCGVTLFATVLATAQDPTCKPGYVWRVTRAADLVCVTPEARARTAEENRRAAERRDPNGAYGPDSCVSGYVWRESYYGDVVCVPPEVRALVQEENRLAPSRRVGG